MSRKGAPDAPVVTSELSSHQVMDTDLQNLQVGASMQIPIRQPLMHSQLGSSPVQVSGPPQSGLRPAIPGVVYSSRMHYAAAVSSTDLVPMVSSNVSGIVTPHVFPSVHSTPEIGRNPNAIPSVNNTPEIRGNPNNLTAIVQMTNI